MKTTFNIALLVASIGLLAIGSSFGASVPAGTTLVVRTLHSFSSVDVPGKTISMQLDKDVVVNGKVALSAGTKISGRIESSKRSRMPTRSEKLTVNITEAHVRGRTVPIKTTGPVNPENPYARTTHRGVQVSTYSYQVPAGTRLQFRLAQPLDI